jgi:hypothetical protein
MRSSGYGDAWQPPVATSRARYLGAFRSQPDMNWLTCLPPLTRRLPREKCDWLIHVSFTPSWVMVRIQLSNSERICVRVLAAEKAPELCVTSALRKTKGAGKAGCALHPRSRVQFAHKKAHTSIQVQRRHPGFPCAMGYGLLRALPGERLSCHRRPREASLLSDLAPAPRRQNHTTSPSAKGAYVSLRPSRPPHLTARS